MRASNWEFKYRALVFGLIFGCSFAMYSLDPQNSTAALANWMSHRLAMDANVLARVLFVSATGLLVVGAFIRTWASAYLQADVVYASDVKTASLVADGPYRHVRNPLYFANLFLALGMGALMSRIGFFVAVIAMFVFCYRLILREETGLESGQGEHYKIYRNAVPRLWPALGPRVPSAGRRPKWAEGFKAEFWCWGFAVSVAAFAITLNTTAFFVISGISFAVFWLSSILHKNRRGSPAP